MKKLLSSYLEHLRLGRKQSHKNLAIFPLLSGADNAPAYLLLDEALRRGALEVSEVSGEGVVPELRVANHSDRMILILDGEELVGAKQNRIVNTTILVQGGSSVVIPVSCVEQGRWHYSSPRFSSEERVLSSSLRAMKADHVQASLDTSGEYRSDQGALWEGISRKAHRMGASTPSMAMAGIYRKEKPSLEAYVRGFKPINGMVGAVFAINGKVAGLDALDSAEAFARVFRKLAESYALDALDGFDPGHTGPDPRRAASALLTAVSAARLDERPSVGLGTDLRLKGKSLTGSALAFEDRVLHLCVFPREAGGNREGGTLSRMASPSRRRAGRRG